MHQIDIRMQDAFTVAAVEHVGAYMKIGQAFETLERWLGTHGLHAAATRLLAVYLDDPASVAEESLHSKACVEIPQPENFPFDATVSRLDVAGGEFAVLRHVGPYTQLQGAYEWLYGEWLPRSGRDPANAPVHEVYLNTPADTAPADLVTEIWLPLDARPA